MAIEAWYVILLTSITNYIWEHDSYQESYHTQIYDNYCELKYLERLGTISNINKVKNMPAL